MELICRDGLRVTRDVCRISARDNGPARLHPVKAPKANALPNTWDEEPFSPSQRIAGIVKASAIKGKDAEI